MSFFKNRLANLPPEQKQESDLYREIVRLGSAIRVARSERNWSQVDLAERSGVAQSDISKIENGAVAQGPTALTLCRLGNALGMQLMFFPTAVAVAEQADAAQKLAQAQIQDALASLERVREDLYRLTASTAPLATCTQWPESSPSMNRKPIDKVVRDPVVMKEVERLVTSIRKAES